MRRDRADPAPVPGCGQAGNMTNRAVQTMKDKTELAETRSRRHAGSRRLRLVLVGGDPTPAGRRAGRHRRIEPADLAGRHTAYTRRILALWRGPVILVERDG